MNTRFTIEEENIVAIYAEDSRETTLENILAAMPYMDEDMRQLAAGKIPGKNPAIPLRHYGLLYPDHLPGFHDPGPLRRPQ